MKRYHQELERTRQTFQRHVQYVFGRRPALIGSKKLQPGHFRKRKAIGCGKSRCLLCHFDKIFQVPTKNDRIQELKFRDSLEDLWNTNSVD